MQFIKSKTGISIVILVGVFIFGYLMLSGVFGETRLGVTLRTNPDLENGLVAHYTFDGVDMDIASNTAEVLDRSANGNNGNWIDHATTTVSGKIGQATELDGVDDYVNTTYGDDFGSSDDFTIALWFKQGLASIGGDESLIGARNSGTNDVINIERDGDGSLCGANDLAIQIENGANDDLYCVPYGNSMDWTHLVASYNNNPDNFSAYINGELVTTGGIISDSTKSLSSYPFYIGAFNSNGTDVDHFTGQIDDVRFYNKSLTADESKRLYGLGATTKIAKTIDSNPDLEDGLIGHWTFDGPDLVENATDKSGNGYDGNLIGFSSTTSKPGILGQALNFDGVNDYVYVDNAVIPDCTFTTMTASVWIKGNVTPSAFDTFFACNVSEGGVGWDMYFRTSSQIEFYIEDYSTNFAYMPGVDGTDWHHVVGTWDGSTIRIYVDNVEGTSDAYSGAISNGKGIEIGRTGSNTYNFDGLIDDARLYDRVLSREEITRLYGLGATTKIAKTIDTNDDLKNGLVGHWSFDGAEVFTQVTDQSGNGNTGYLDANMPTTTAVVPGIIGQALTFDGSDDFVNVGDIAETDTLPFSIAAWINLDALPTVAGENFEIVTKYDASSDDHWRMFVRTADNAITFQEFGSDCDGGNGYLALDGSPGKPLNSGDLGEWIHVVATYAADGTFTFYVDGDFAGDDTFSTSVCNGVTDVWIGAQYVGGTDSVFDGKIDDVRIYSKVLTAQEVKRLYQLGQ